jgi:uncharacterized protein YidB (DUF937 family)
VGRILSRCILDDPAGSPHEETEVNMGLLDDLIGGMGGGGGETAPRADNPLEAILTGLGGGGKGQMILMAAMALLQSSGGLSGLLQLFQKHGMGEEASSWIGTGANKAITGDVISKVFGTSAISAFASQAGIAPNEAGPALARVLPELVNQFTPTGSVAPEADDMLVQGLALLKGGLG